MKNYLLGLVSLFFVIACSSSDDHTPSDPNCPDLGEISNSSIEGFGILSKTVGIWNGPVTSSTPLGSYPEWIVDFRPISPSHVAAKNELDSINDIFMSFFVTKYDCAYKMAFRNGGGFAGLRRNSYMIIDSVFESSSNSFYRFSDPISGGNRVSTEVSFSGNNMRIRSFTNQYNTLVNPTIHMDWQATLQDLTSSEEAVNFHNFPQKQVEKDFSNTFDGLSEAVFYSDEANPFPEEEQPYLGNATVNVSISNPALPDVSKKVIVVISTEPLFNGFIFSPVNLKYRSRYVLLSASATSSYNFNYMHPGNFFVNAVYDSDGNLTFNSGDFVNGNFDVPLSLLPESSETVSININLEIP